ncbi:thioesterase [Paenibacillus sp. 1011MAR3C5]|uniref:thioesterase II family protein n=1 Tax=Paenibacillus sp. 1011MAR3C5 TaxID=1675787 RepID=UPI000E6CCE52|nr:alpha/beta fold hydrolase [Paenibacillus sp. 1011MAR3C5]RJE85176.1 thioesterase [Paenibacillus sp. 1011MAR3C5]
MNLQRTDSPWLHIPKPNPGARLRLVCFPYAGGSATIYREWPAALSPEIEVVAIQLPGRGNRFMDKPVGDLDAIIKPMLATLTPYLEDKPFVLFGHSMGAMLAYESAKRLESALPGRLKHLFASAFRSVQLPRTDHGRYLLSNAELKEELRKLNGTPEALLQNDELMELYLPTIRADMQLCDTYSYEASSPLGCGLTVFGGVSDSDIPQEDLQAWESQAGEAFELHMLPGDHFFIHSESRQLLQLLARKLEHILHLHTTV